MDMQFAIAGAAIGAFLAIEHQHIAEQTGQHRAMDRIQRPIPGRGAMRRQLVAPGIAHGAPQLMPHIGPLAHAPETEVQLIAHPALGRGAAGFIPAIPQLQHRGQIAGFMHQFTLRRFGLGFLPQRTHARILH